jgi:hypothetical protein
MKPTLKNFRSHKRADALETESPRFPITNWNYQSVALGGFSGHCAKLTPSFRDISRDYFDKEAHNNFAKEAALFGTMLAMAAMPLISTALAVIHLLRTVGTF